MSTEVPDPSSALTSDRPSAERPEVLHSITGECRAELSEHKPHTPHSPLLTVFRESPSSALRDQRSCSDAYVHAVSRSRAAAAAALARTANGHAQTAGCTQCHHHQQQQQQHQNPLLLPLLHQHLLPLHKHSTLHHSQGSLPNGHKSGTGWTAGSEVKSSTKSHSQSSLARLMLKPLTERHCRSTSSLAHSRRALGPEEEIKYVWRDGRVQVQQPHAARDGLGYSEHRTSLGQHVEYLWQGGNVQKVIRGPNNEMLATEAVPPRGQVKGVNYCVIYCLLFVFVVTVVILIVILKVLY